MSVGKGMNGRSCVENDARKGGLRSCGHGEGSGSGSGCGDPGEAMDKLVNPDTVWRRDGYRQQQRRWV